MGISSVHLFPRSLPVDTFRWVTGPQRWVYKHVGWVNGALFSDKAKCCNTLRLARRWKQNRFEQQLLIVNRKDNNGWWGERLPRQSCATEADDMMEPSHSSLWQPVKKKRGRKLKNRRHRGVCDDYSRHSKNPSVKLSPTLPPAALSGAGKTINRKITTSRYHKGSFPAEYNKHKGFVWVSAGKYNKLTFLCNFSWLTKLSDTLGPHRPAGAPNNLKQTPRIKKICSKLLRINFVKLQTAQIYIMC